ncbi:hypothetical protein MLD38_030158 [Melastoma candidum]|uniref:Uncharacterized protein n=1 Tax=Melastoma candidum TaxID=119954 RepID=A0ACB9MMP7_9MYRT|nr:hypothetical protein MLD38_030158 [Melastoma candidum]
MKVKCDEEYRKKEIKLVRKASYFPLLSRRSSFGRNRLSSVHPGAAGFWVFCAGEEEVHAWGSIQPSEVFGFGDWKVVKERNSIML